MSKFSFLLTYSTCNNAKKKTTTKINVFQVHKTVTVDYLNIYFLVPIEGAPEGPLHGASSRKKTHRPRPFILFSKSLVVEPSSSFPKRGPYGKKYPYPEPFLHILQVPSKCALPLSSLHWAPTQRDTTPP